MKPELSISELRHQAWALQVQQQIKSGLPISEWCAQNGIGIKAYEYHKRVVRKELISSIQPSFAEVPLQVPEESSTQISNDPSQPAITISVSGMNIGINSNATRQLIKDVLEVIRNA